MPRIIQPWSLVLAVLLTPTLASAHAHLKEAQPAESASAAAVPDLRLLYTEPLDLDRSSLALRSNSGQAVPLPPLAADQTEPNAALLHLVEPLPPGAYIVEWKAVAARNGHETAGTPVRVVGQTGARLLALCGHRQR